jgi:hypothetical protein
MISSQSRRFPLQRSMNEAAVKRAKEVLSSKGIALPCVITAVNGSLVTVAFKVAGLTLPPITMPIAQSQYDQAPYQVGDPGVARPADADLYNISGQSTTQPGFQTSGNLGTLAFHPVSNVSWPANTEPSMYLLQGPGGFLLQSMDGSVSISGKKGGALTLTYAGNSITIGPAGVAIVGTLTVNGQPYLGHEHTGGNGTASPTGGVIGP